MSNDHLKSKALQEALKRQRERYEHSSEFFRTHLALAEMHIPDGVVVPYPDDYDPTLAALTHAVLALADAVERGMNK